MKKILPFLSMIFLSQFICAQNPQVDYKYTLKIYNLASFEEYTNSTDPENGYSTLFSFNTRKLDILHPTIAFQWSNKKRNFHEVELTRFTLGNVASISQSQNVNSNTTQLLDSERTTTIDISLRYEYILNFRKGQDKKMIPSLGFAINPYCNNIVTRPQVSTSFPTSSWHLGARIFVVPRLNFSLSSRIFLDVNIPICLMDNYQLRNKYDSPIVSLDNRITYSNLIDFMPKMYSLRIGFGFKF